jgi:hypothetical protein
LFSRYRKEKTDSKLIVANTELTFQNKEKKNQQLISCCQYRTTFKMKKKEKTATGLSCCQ